MKDRFRSRSGRFVKYADIWVLIIILIVFVILFGMSVPNFLSLNTWESIGFQFPELGILTIAMAVTMIVGGINLSCIASANLSAIVMTLVMSRMIPEGTDSIAADFTAVGIGIALSILIGILNGIIIACFNVPDILATLSTQLLLGGLNLVITRGNIFPVVSDKFRYIGNGSFLGIPMPVWIFLGCMVIVTVVVTRTVMGKSMYLYGSNPEASRFNGTGRTGLVIRTYALSGLFVGIAAVLMTSRFNSASAGYASSYLLQTVLVAVLAGIDPDGGKGRIIGIVIAILLIQIIASGFNMLHVNTHLANSFWGLILILSVGIKRKWNSSSGYSDAS